MSESGADRRSSPRVPLRLLVQFKVQTLEEFLERYASNLSIGGMFIDCDEPHPLGAMVYLQFRVVDGGTLIEGLGRVAHVNPPGSERCGMGVEFVNLDEDSLEFIDGVIERRISSAE
jgi:uncharacterized protein (TIGR02266 family)